MVGPFAGIFLSLLLVLLGSTSAHSDAPSESRVPLPELDLFIDEMVEKHGFDRAELKGVLDLARVRQGIIRTMSKPAEALPWNQYRPRFINDARIRGGLKFWNENTHSLVVARLTYGVPEAVTTAIIGVETGYGSYTGSHRVLDALLTLAFYSPSRAPMFRRELEHYLLLTREEGWVPTSVKGSYAGAIGLAQFMPTSYRRYGVDFDGDGRRDLNRNVEDAIGSVANYFSVHGWERGLPVVTRAKVSRKPSRHDLETRRSVGEWRSRGVVPLEDAPDDWEAMLIALRTKQGPQYWLGFKNFYVITRYNHSTNYAMAVYELSLEIQDLHRQSKTPLE